MPSGQTRKSSRRAEVKDWRAKALRYHIDGLTLREVAKKVGKALSTVHEGIEAELAEITLPFAAELNERRERERENENLRLLAVIAGSMAKARRGDAEASHVVISASRQRSKLLGLEAPTRTEHTGRDGGPIATFDLGKLTDDQIDSIEAQLDRLVDGDEADEGETSSDPAGAGEGGKATPPP